MTGRPLRFDGRVVVVTGAAGGLGRAHAALFADRGARVVLSDRDDLGSVVEGLPAGSEVTTVAADIATPAGATAVVEAALDAFGRLDVLVNNAGALASADVGATTDDLFDEMVAVNLGGSFRVTRAAWPHLMAAAGGRVVFTTSNSGLLGIAGSSAYAAAKAGLWGLTRVLAIEGAPLGIAVNAVAPVAFTAMSQSSRAAPSSWQRGERDAWAERLAPARVSPVVAWLAHPECQTTGEVVSVAGGRVARFFLGLTTGVVVEDLTIEAVRDAESSVMATTDFAVPSSAGEETSQLHRRLMPRSAR